jgi:hypothetical protein
MTTSSLKAKQQNLIPSLNKELWGVKNSINRFAKKASPMSHRTPLIGA